MDIEIFRSTFVEETRTLIAGFSKAYLRFVSAIMLPIMIVTLFAALEQSNLLPYIYWGYPGGLLVSGIATVYWLRTKPGVIERSGDRVRVLTIWDGLAGLRDRWAYLIDFSRDGQDRALLTVGLDTYRVGRGDWPDYDNLIEAMEEAFAAYQIGRGP